MFSLLFRTGLRLRCMVVSLENLACSTHRFKTVFCFRPLHLSFYLSISFIFHNNITRRHDLAPSLLCCRTGTTIHWNAVHLVSKKLTLLRINT
jgi:hypothetical protein